jgi:hypothetical protein
MVHVYRETMNELVPLNMIKIYDIHVVLRSANQEDSILPSQSGHSETNRWIIN